LIKLIR